MYIFNTMHEWVLVIPILVLLIIGIAVGALTGMTGSSGVLVVVPALELLGFTFQVAVGTSLLVDVITTSVVAFVYLRKKSLDVKVALLMGFGAVIGAQIGTRFAISISQTPLEVAFVLLTAILAFQMFRRAGGHSLGQAWRHDKIRINRSLMLAFVMSIPVGFLTGTLGTSGGVMFIGIILLLFAMSAQKMVGTATLAMFLSAASGATGYISVGRISIISALLIGVTSLASGILFSYVAHRVAERIIYLSIGLVFVAVIVLEIFKIIL